MLYLIHTLSHYLLTAFTLYLIVSNTNIIVYYSERIVSSNPLANYCCQQSFIYLPTCLAACIHAIARKSTSFKAQANYSPPVTAVKMPIIFLHNGTNMHPL